MVFYFFSYLRDLVCCHFESLLANGYLCVRISFGRLAPSYTLILNDSRNFILEAGPISASMYSWHSKSFHSVKSALTLMKRSAEGCFWSKSSLMTLMETICGCQLFLHCFNFLSRSFLQDWIISFLFDDLSEGAKCSHLDLFDVGIRQVGIPCNTGPIYNLMSVILPLPPCFWWAARLLLVIINNSRLLVLAGSIGRSYC